MPAMCAMYALLLLSLATGSWQLSIKEFSVPSSVALGSDVELRCQYELAPGETETPLFLVKWWWKTADDTRQIYQRIWGRAAEAVHNEDFSQIEVKASDTIVLKNVTTVDSGTYECEVSNDDEVRQRDTLIVYNTGTGPSVNVSELEDEEGKEQADFVLIECEAENFAPIPSLSVKVNNEEIKIDTVTNDEDNDGLYSIYGNATFRTTDVDEMEVRCELFYSNPNITHPLYEDVKTYVPAGMRGRGPAPPAAAPAAATEPAATPESLQNASDDGVQLQSSWLLLTIATFIAFLQVVGSFIVQ